jgi:hypothetical protein
MYIAAGFLTSSGDLHTPSSPNASGIIGIELKVIL